MSNWDDWEEDIDEYLPDPRTDYMATRDLKIESIFMPVEANAFTLVFDKAFVELLKEKLGDAIADYFYIDWELIEEWGYEWSYSPEHYPDLDRWRWEWRRKGYKLIEVYFELDYSSCFLAVKPEDAKRVIKTIKLLTKLVELSIH